MTPTNPDIKGSLIPTSGLDEDEQLNFTVLYTGFPKTGKTHCLCTWPSPLVLFFDKNFATLKKHGVSYVSVPDWEFYSAHILPLLKRRVWMKAIDKGVFEEIPFPYRTLVIDTVSSMGDYLLDYLTEKRKLDGWDLWAAVASNMARAISIPLQLAKHVNGKPSAHVIASCHLDDVFNEKRNLVKTKLDIPGRTASHLPKWFDTTILCKSEVKKTDTVPAKILGKDYFVHTINTSRFIEFLGDGVGGGKYKELPPKTGGTYPELMKAWGIASNDQT